MEILPDLPVLVTIHYAIFAANPPRHGKVYGAEAVAFP
jgi:hypothetical protein